MVSSHARLHRSRATGRFALAYRSPVRQTGATVDGDPTPTKKTCFVISPMGESASHTRAWADNLFEQVIEPALKKKEYETKRCDHHLAHWILQMIIDRITAADLVVCILTDHNFNVAWELGVADAYGRPVVLLALEGTKIPFDMLNRKVLFYPAPGSDGGFLDAKFEKVRSELAVHSEAAETNVRQSQFLSTIRAYGGRYSLLAVYDGKDGILSVFKTGIQDVLISFDSDWELKEGTNPETLRRLAKLIEDPAGIYREHCRALHQTVALAHLEAAQQETCHGICRNMSTACCEALALADKLKRKIPLEADDIPQTRKKLLAILGQANDCQNLVRTEREKIVSIR